MPFCLLISVDRALISIDSVNKKPERLNNLSRLRTHNGGIRFLMMIFYRGDRNVWYK
ncbi:hypothetical protein NIES4075_28430 [Tolypothrix sp. NIES-4075]|uniref:hypothetical protein n=1 Tax=Tolypothrix sp. NIES-4075 TaxID=2005459 RepID=UPI000B6AF9E4|nr:hypothetical protein [Tolypothrix sp. NIES-4075]GAX41846.1 hypothetical protein NIES4075_28430 [Tolypothrix sp. NIES-4075]